MMMSSQPSMRKRIFLFYQHASTGEPVFDPFESRFLEVLCKKYDVVIVFFSRKKIPKIDPKVAPEGATFLCLPDVPVPSGLLWIRWPLQTITRIMRIFLLLRTSRVDIVLGNWVTRMSGFYCAFARFHPFLAIAWGSDILIEAKKSFILRAFGKFTIHAADGVIVDSEIQQKAVLELGAKLSKIYSFPWGIDIDRFSPKPSRLREELGWTNDKVIVSTRKHFPVYDVESLIRAIPIIRNKVKNARFLIIGDGPLLEAHKSLAKELGIVDEVKFLGTVRNELLPEVLNAADLYVSTSLSDGTSASLLEALACGLPVVVTRIPANKEWLIEGENGYMVTVKDYKELANRLIETLQDDNLMAQMRAANLKVAQERADWKINSRILEKSVADLLPTVD